MAKENKSNPKEKLDASALEGFSLLHKTMNKNDKIRNRFSDLPAYFCKSLDRGLPCQNVN
jgi:hypothetical protein